MSMDVNSMKPLDNLCHPVSVIRQAEELAAEAFGSGPRIFNGGRDLLPQFRLWSFLWQREGRRSFFPETSTEA